MRRRFGVIGLGLSDKPRQLLLYECGAADAWPLVNFTTLEEYDSRMICGSSTLEPRFEKVPVRIPYPVAINQGSIYENQSSTRTRYFDVKAASHSYKQLTRERRVSCLRYRPIEAGYDTSGPGCLI